MRKIMRILPVTLALVAGNFAHASITANDALPTSSLTCGGSVITEIGGRLEGDTNFQSGVSVFFANHGGQVSYLPVPEIIHSKVGDHVLVCLVYIPENCPTWDDRGKIYTTTNLRTLQSWTLPDSEHSCGGA